METHTKGGHQDARNAATQPSFPSRLCLRAKNTRQIGRPMFLQSLAALGRQWMPRLRGSHLQAPSRKRVQSTELAVLSLSLSFSLSLPPPLLHVSLPLFFQALNMYHMTE